jgi:hypothetical protein
MSFVKKKQSEQFKMSDLGSLSYFLGIEVDRTDEMVTISLNNTILRN